MNNARSEPIDVGTPAERNKDEKQAQESDVTACDRVTNAVALLLVAAVMVTSVVCVAAGACCLASLKGLPFERFELFFAFGVAPVVAGVLVLVTSVAGLLFIIFCAMGLTRYGMCFAGGSRWMKAFNVCVLGVFPFLVFVVLLVFCILGFSFHSLSRQLPPLDKDYAEVPGVTGPVHIIRDENGLVHVKASSRHDAYFGQGFAEAQDRLFQLEFRRLVGLGELASVVGAGGIAADKATRTLNIKASAASLCKYAKASDLALLQAFVDGVNYYLQHVSKRPVEFFFMSKPLYFHEPKPFTIEDLCVTMRLVQWQMSSNIKKEADRFSKFFTPLQRNYSQVESLFNNFTGANHTILTAEQLNLTDSQLQANIVKHKRSHDGEEAIYNQLLSMVRKTLPLGKLAQIRSPQDFVEESLKPVFSEGFSAKGSVNVFANKYLHASNAWAARDAKNHSVAASDPHLLIELPSVWYYIHLSFPDEDGEQYDTAGVAKTGIPGVHIGKTTYVSWGITMSLTDLEDLFVIANVQDLTKAPTSYMYRGKERMLVPRRERIAVRGSKDVVLDVEDTLFGPVVNEMVGGERLPAGIKLALYAVPLRHDDKESISVLLSLSDPAIKTAHQLMTSLLNLRSPGFSIPIADREGNIAYAVTGRHPMRTVGHTGKYPCVLLVTGNDTYVSDDPSVEDSLVPPEANPHFHSPADGKPMHISAANQKIYPDGYPYELGFDFAWSYRGRRLHELLDALQVEDGGSQLANITRHRQIQQDIRSNIWMQDFRPIVKLFTVSTESTSTKRWHERLMAWDGQASIGSQEAAFFWRWLQSLSVLPLDTQGSTPAERYVWRMLSQRDSVMDTICVGYAAQMKTKPVTDCMQLAFVMFKRLAETNFQERWGIDMNRLTGVHTMLHEKILRPVFERTIEKDGDMSSLCVSGNNITGDLDSTQASSMRQLYDMQDPDTMYFAIPGGESGNPYSEFYQNLLDKFAKRDYVKVATSGRAVNELQAGGRARHHQVLSP
ncbi:peptidase s45 penicillin amidase [Trypanosoma grayi]|uniref:peptidase s45 penicillin amidase n=1 Tax=Trypanosoma grayi TaxID=71804 RepID=UPI0004F4ACEB|nr:peptidase s45 penicillin amidase [Trypanosoma grayi]KEG10755.1 peptidase s45 penicillin amidase [Trypanosoma grayi]